MRSSRPRILSSFDWFVLAVLLGYALVVFQAIADGRTQPLPFTPSTQLWYDRVLPPAELPEGAAMSQGSQRLDDLNLQ